MAKMKIVFFETEKWECDILQHLCGEAEIVFCEKRLDARSAAAYLDADVISTFVHSTLDRETLDPFSRLKFITTRSTGIDHIDLEYCRTKAIPVSNVPTYGGTTVAEHVFALLLAISHHIPEAVNRTRRGDFSQAGLRGFDLQNKTLGVIGTGHIGKRVAEIARGFRMEVMAYDPAPDEAFARQAGLSYVDWQTLLTQSDCITLHVPGGVGTRHMISGEAFSRMKKGVILINTARGSVVDVKALLRALAEGRVAAAGLDVLPEEPSIREEAELLRSFFSQEHDLETLLADHLLLRMRNVIITPHSAFNTTEAVEKILRTTAGNIQGFLHGKLQNVVT
ncbi:hydroxyacid dehydrogenase [Paremcibacter congregatus]|uniref:hydroxyacid dehydrogenase n=1 Tax=Paremcibacter congregatus TaxID=2043170 RepID=UPI003A8F6E56